MQEITLNNKQYILYPIQENEHSFFKQNYKSHSVLSFKIGNKGGNGAYNDPNLYIGYEIIGKISDILKNEDICKRLVENHPNLGYRDYHPDAFIILENWTANWRFSKATDSFLSYLQSINLDMTKEYLIILKN